MCVFWLLFVKITVLIKFNIRKLCFYCLYNMSGFNRLVSASTWGRDCQVGFSVAVFEVRQRAGDQWENWDWNQDTKSEKVLKKRSLLYAAIYMQKCYKFWCVALQLLCVCVFSLLKAFTLRFISKTQPWWISAHEKCLWISVPALRPHWALSVRLWTVELQVELVPLVLGVTSHRPFGSVPERQEEGNNLRWIRGIRT